MEEKMNYILLALSQGELSYSDIPVKTQEKIFQSIEAIKKDTLNHKKIVLEIRESLSG